MDQILVAFITGLTTGGLSCLAVQGGLLASSLGQQLEQEMLNQPRSGKVGRYHPQKKTRGMAVPILLFLSAKMLAYTLLGLVLGGLGSVLQLTASMRAVLLIGIGIFMLGNGLRMLNVHPIFRYFTVEPPKFITRYIRRKAKNANDWYAPLFLGALTVFIPCGVTQAMMAVAIGTGSPVMGAALMFAFILGTSPVFFAVAYLATRLGQALEKWFMRFVAVSVLVLGLLSINSGLNLAGFSPFTPSQTDNPALAGSALPPAGLGDGTLSSSAENVLILNAENSGYRPQVLHAPADTALTLNLVTDKTFSCSRAFVIPALNKEVLLPATGVVKIQIPPQAAGSEMQFTCSMGMYTGVIIFDA
jgi:sulfite exporter TauE/SafE